MSELQACMIKRPWYNTFDRFPLIPTVRIREADKYNTWSFHFHWLVFRAWTMDSTDIGIEINLDDTFGIKFRIPYLIFGIWIPVLPSCFSQRYFWRKPKREETHDRFLG